VIARLACRELPILCSRGILKGTFTPSMTAFNHLNKPKRIKAMNRKLILTLAATVALTSTLTAEEPWFDLEKCAYCKEFAKQPGLVEHMKTEYHNTKNGIISVTYVDKAYQPAMEKAHAGIGQVVADKTSGKPVVACKHCSAIGDFYQMGLMPESIKSEKCTIVIYSSPDAAVVTKLQDFGRKTNEAIAEFDKKKEASTAKN